MAEAQVGRYERVLGNRYKRKMFQVGTGDPCQRIDVKLLR